jgi:sulfatase modifying factor 1
MEFVEIGRPDVPADIGTTLSIPVGAVPYSRGQVDRVYAIGKYEVSADQVMKANSEGNLGISYNWNGAQPAGGIGWFEAAKFVNWLNTYKGFQPAYKTDPNHWSGFGVWTSGETGYDSANLFRNSEAKFFLPSADEWYKAAFSSPSGNWYDYTTGSNSPPISVVSGTATGTEVYGLGPYAEPAEITQAGGLSPWGTMAQGGNIWEITESSFDGTNNDIEEQRIKFGSSYVDDNVVHMSSAGQYIDSSIVMESRNVGFRIAMVPEPSSLSLLLAGGAVLMAGRRRG